MTTSSRPPPPQAHLSPPPTHHDHIVQRPPLLWTQAVTLQYTGQYIRQCTMQYRSACKILTIKEHIRVNHQDMKPPRSPIYAPHSPSHLQQYQALHEPNVWACGLKQCDHALQLHGPGDVICNLGVKELNAL